MVIQPGSLPFTDYLRQLPPAWVLENFFKEDRSSRKILSSAMIEESARKFTVAEELERRFFSLSTGERYRCAKVYFLEKTGCAAASGNGFEDPLVTAFLAYAAKNQRGQVRIFGFREFEPLLRKALVTTILEGASTDGSHPPLPVWKWRCLNDITLVASLSTQHLLARKRTGKLSVAALKTVKKLIHFGPLHKTEDVEYLSGAIIGYCVAKNLLSETEREYLFCPSAFSGWFSAGLEERTDDVLEYMLSYCGLSPDSIDLIRSLCARAETRWVGCSWIGDNDRTAVRRILLLLQFCGLIEVRKSTGGLLFQLVPKEEGRQPDGEQPVVIMPDFTVIMPQECLPATVFTFTRFCKFHSLDRVYHGTIEKQTLTEALSGGMSSERIISSLRQCRAPVNVLESVREWIREFHRLSISTESMLLTGDENVAAQVAAFEELQPFIEKVPVHTLFRIRPGCENSVRDVVRKLGFDDRMSRMRRQDDPVTEHDLLQDIQDAVEWTLIVEGEPDTVRPSPAIRGTKYGAELKELELSEVVQVIDYAILTSQRLAFSYEGSPYVRKGIYTITPILCSKGAEPMLEGELQRTGTRKRFYLKKICAIGVVPQ